MSLLFTSRHLFTTLNRNSSVTLLLPLSPRCKSSSVLRSERSHPGSNQASYFTCILEAQIPRCTSHISDDAMWSILSNDADLKDARSVIQYGLDVLLEIAVSSDTRLRTSSHWNRRILCRSSVSSCWNSRTINSRVMMQGRLCTLQLSSLRYAMYYRLVPCKHNRSSQCEQFSLMSNSDRCRKSVNHAEWFPWSSYQGDAL